jgi:hypothetical protein
MTPYSPTSRGQRAALATVSAVLSLSLMASVLMLFSDGQLPWTPLEAKAKPRDPSCAATGAVAARCPAPVAQGSEPAASTLTVVQKPLKGDPNIHLASE